MLELYQFEECEYSAQVRLKMSEWEVDCILRNVSRDKSRRPILKKISGRSETPTLVDTTRDMILVGDEQQIIRHIGKYYRKHNRQKQSGSADVERFHGGAGMIQIKRVYNEPVKQDGVRILVDRVWPRGFSKKRASIDEWRKELAPSTALRKWFGHDPAKWTGFRERYRKELVESDGLDALKELARRSHDEAITLVYGAADEQHNQAVALKEFISQLS
ncbi:MAG: uncharacterized protein K0S45_2376 [Nitrospira sp.]|jgi:uncharacterized protein YeaO (DUF488 family)|nr:uncharacterized protein [Nitrospira sp.]